MSSNKKLNDMENQIKNLENKIIVLEKKNKENDKILKSYHNLLNTLLINHKVFPSELILLLIVSSVPTFLVVTLYFDGIVTLTL